MTVPGDLPDLVRSRLFERRMVLLSGPLTGPLASEVAAQLMTLDATGDGPVVLRVDSPESSYEAAFVVMDTIDLLGVPVWTQAAGLVGGPAVGVVAVGARRWAAPHAALNLIEPRTASSGRFEELQRWAEDQSRQRWRFLDRLAGTTGRRPEELAREWELGRCLEATEAVAHGLVDQVGSPPLPS